MLDGKTLYGWLRHLSVCLSVSAPPSLWEAASHTKRFRSLVLYAALEVGGDGNVDLGWFGQAEGVHEVDELVLGLGQPRVEPDLLPHTAHLTALVVVSRVQLAALWEREDLLPHALVQQGSVATLEVSSAAAPDEQSVAREGHGVVVEDVCQAPVGVSRGGAALHEPIPEVEGVAVLHFDVGNGGLVGAGEHTLEAIQAGLHLAGARHMVGVHVCVEGVFEYQSVLVEELQISVEHLQHGIDDDGLARRGVGQHVAVRARLAVKQLTEKQVTLALQIHRAGSQEVLDPLHEVLLVRLQEGQLVLLGPLHGVVHGHPALQAPGAGDVAVSRRVSGDVEHGNGTGAVVGVALDEGWQRGALQRRQQTHSQTK
mmetsp:Transcript_48082/g.120395  ORF Transcript_48082/g.120395 Transcript_48082/m.120395 type:complete len:370 (-) Transcript_48082:406-1515(-)